MHSSIDVSTGRNRPTSLKEVSHGAGEDRYRAEEQRSVLGPTLAAACWRRSASQQLGCRTAGVTDLEQGKRKGEILIPHSQAHVSLGRSTIVGRQASEELIVSVVISRISASDWAPAKSSVLRGDVKPQSRRLGPATIASGFTWGVPPTLTASEDAVARTIQDGRRPPARLAASVAHGVHTASALSSLSPTTK